MAHSTIELMQPNLPLLLNLLLTGKEYWLLREKLKKAQPTSATWTLIGSVEIGRLIQLVQVYKLKTQSTPSKTMSRTMLLFLIKLLTLLSKHDPALLLKITLKIIILRVEIQPLELWEVM